MTVYDIMDLFIDDSQYMELYDTETDNVVYSGEYCDIPEEYTDREVCSIDNVYKDNNGIVTLNIE